MQNTEPRDHCFHFVIAQDGKRLQDVGILKDGSLHNPNGYDPDVVRHEIGLALGRQHARRSKAAKKAAATRATRTNLMVYRAASMIILDQRTGPREHCCICGRGLDDAASIQRGIGSECWQQVLTAIEVMRVTP